MSPLKGFPMYMKVGIVTGSIGVCSRQARRVTRANGNVRGAAYLASWPQLQRVAFSSSRERESGSRASLQLPAHSVLLVQLAL